MTHAPWMKPCGEAPKEVTAEEFERFVAQLDLTGTLQRNLIDCTLPENDGRLCFRTDCYHGQKALRYCQGRRCQKSVFLTC